MNKYKVLVGVLYCREADFEECMAAIHSQTGVDVEVVVIRDRPNKAAHEELYEAFMQRSESVDFFAKIDADMIVCDSDFLARVGRLFEETPRARLVTVPVLDYFSGKLIRGLNCFRNNVIWSKSQETVFVDREPVGKKEVLIARHLAPAALHCFRVGGFHAYHYGIHRGLKMRTALLSPHEGGMRRFHVANYFDLVVNAPCAASVDRRLLLARYGMVSALLGGFDPSVVEYSNPTLRSQYERELASLTAEQLLRLILAAEKSVPCRLRLRMLIARISSSLRRRASVARRAIKVRLAGARAAEGQLT